MRATIVTLIILTASIGLNFHQCGKTARLRDNISTLKSDVELYMTADSVLAARTKRQSATIGELKADNSRLTQEVKAMGVKLKHLQSVQQIEQKVEYKFEVDTVIIIDTITKEPVPQYEFHDDWIDFKMLGGAVSVETRDSLVVVRHQRRRKFLCWTFKRYTGQVIVENRNPNARIVGVSEIDIID